MSLSQSCAFLHATQERDGAWRLPPAPRVLENALVVLTAGKHPALEAQRAQAERWLRSATPQGHHGIPAQIDRWLLAAASGWRAPLDLRNPAFEEPAFRHRKLFFNALALHLGCPVEGGAEKAALIQLLQRQLSQRQTARMKSWSAAELASLLLVLCEPGELPAQTVADALEVLSQAQTVSGSIAENPISTAVAAAALMRWAPDSAELRAALACLARDQQSDGTWRFSTADVWDTALTLRTFARCPLLRPEALQAGREFLLRSQNPDGGWPYRSAVESDTDTTGMAALGLDPVEHRPALARSSRYLRATRTPEGLWRTWHYKDDPPAEDAVAHAVLALRQAGEDEAEVERATSWLATQLNLEQGWHAHWYNIQSYAAHEIGMALGRQHEATRFAARKLMEQQAADGGWSPAPGHPTTAAATGMALALLCQYVAKEHPAVEAAVGYLLANQDDRGAWVGPTDMYAPRPFAVDYPFQTHALAAIGMMAVHAKALAPRQERRQGPRVGDYLSVEPGRSPQRRA